MHTNRNFDLAATRQRAPLSTVTRDDRKPIRSATLRSWHHRWTALASPCRRRVRRFRCSARRPTTDAVSQIAFDHQLRIVEISETSRSLEEILLDITGATAEFASV